METKERLISADGFIEDIKTEIMILFLAGMKGTPRSREELYEIIDRINEQPTVDAVEVVHGRWIPVPSSDMMTGKAYKCSECGKMRYGSYFPNFCQNCGAKMDGERKYND